METTGSQTLKINITGSIQALYDEYQKQVDSKPEKSFTSLELYIECREYQDKTKLAPHIFFSDLLLLIMQNNPDLKKIRVEGYERYCYTKQYVVWEPAEFGLFCKFTDLVQEYKETGQTQPYFINLEEFNFHKCCLNESDLQVLGSSLFPNLKRMFCYWCAPYTFEIREKYRDFLPFVEWEDAEEYDRHTGVKNTDYYSETSKDQVEKGYPLEE